MYGHIKVKDHNSVSIGPEAGNMAGNKRPDVAVAPEQDNPNEGKYRIHKENPTRCSNVAKFYYSLFI
jgi:hypothetical protein